MEIEPFLEQIRRAGMPVAVHSARLILEGWDSVVMEVNQDWIFRFPRRPEVVEQQRRELGLLNRLAGSLPCRVPQPCWTRTADEHNWGFMGYPKIAGEAISADALNDPQIADQVSRFLESLHSFPQFEAEQVGVRVYTPQSWRAEYAEFFAWAQSVLFPLLDADTRARQTGLWLSYLDQPGNFRFQPVLIHGDLGLEHILWDAVDRRLTGVIDWEDARLGDPALDFAGVMAACGEKAVQKLLDCYSLPPGEGFWERLDFYTLIIPYYAVRFGLEQNLNKPITHGLAQIRTG